VSVAWCGDGVLVDVSVRVGGDHFEVLSVLASLLWPLVPFDFWMVRLDVSMRAVLCLYLGE
jgi:hypothetical protein